MASSNMLAVALEVYLGREGMKYGKVDPIGKRTTRWQLWHRDCILLDATSLGTLNLSLIGSLRQRVGMARGLEDCRGYSCGEVKC